MSTLPFRGRPSLNPPKAVLPNRDRNPNGASDISIPAEETEGAEKVIRFLGVDTLSSC